MMFIILNHENALHTILLSVARKTILLMEIMPIDFSRRFHEHENRKYILENKIEELLKHV